jgi:hypothetical protein
MSLPKLVPIVLAGMVAVACSDAPASPPLAPPPPGPAREAGFLVAPPRDVSLHGTTRHVGAEARLFYDFVPARTNPETRPIFVLTNGFSARIVRAYGTGPVTVANDGTTRPNAASLDRFANLVWIDPRQSGFSYDVVTGRAPTVADDCGSSVFDEYVDAADVLFATLAFLRAHSELRAPSSGWPRATRPSASSGC